MPIYPDPDRNLPPGSGNPTSLGAGRSGGRDVIVCDDERHIVRLIQVNLERNGFTVRAAFNGQDCLAMVRNNCPHLLILDQDMPYMTGDQVVQAIRADPATEHLRIVLLKKDSNDDSSWPTAVISKPFNPLDLMRLLS